MSSSLNHTALLDSGTVCISVPAEIADAYNKLYDPPAIYVDDLGLYVTKCDAQPPKQPFHITISGKRFVIPGEDLLLPGTVMSTNGAAAPDSPYASYCVGAMQRAGTWGPYEYVLATREECGLGYFFPRDNGNRG
jgi:hypothetical protein